MRRAFPSFAVLDVLTALIVGLGLLLGVALLAVNVKAKPTIDTPGTAAVVVTWPGRLNDDVDTYVRDPEFRVLYFDAPSIGLMHLEHDILGWRSFKDNHGREHPPTLQEERVVVRGVESGEFVVNVHLYAAHTAGPVTVTVTLWTLRGADRPVVTKLVVLRREGDEQTALRFRMNSQGRVAYVDQRPATLAGESYNPMAHYP